MGNSLGVPHRHQQEAEPGLNLETPLEQKVRWLAVLCPLCSLHAGLEPGCRLGLSFPVVEGNGS